MIRFVARRHRTIVILYKIRPVAQLKCFIPFIPVIQSLKGICKSTNNNRMNALNLDLIYGAISIIIASGYIIIIIVLLSYVVALRDVDLQSCFHMIECGSRFIFNRILFKKRLAANRGDFAKFVLTK